MLEKLFAFLSLGCHHRRISKPFAAATASQNPASSDWDALPKQAGAHYVVCLECGKKFGYDWAQMKMIR